jgi:hypothetical protein
MGKAQAQTNYQDFQNLSSHVSGAKDIFLNNFPICLVIFIPVLGPLIAFSIMYNTGRVIAAVAIVRGVNPGALFAATFIFPHSWIEYSAYGLALSQSFWLIVGIARHRTKSELVSTLIMIGASAVILFVAAIVEWATISAFK